MSHLLVGTLVSFSDMYSLESWMILTSQMSNFYPEMLSLRNFTAASNGTYREREREREFLDTGHHVPTTCDYFVKENNMDLDYERKFPFGKNMLYFK